jgi:hypothetical protein
MLRDRARD